MKVTVPIALALAVSAAEARQSLVGRNLLSPRQYHGARDPFDLVSEIFSSPMYNVASSLLRQDLESINLPNGPRYAVTQNSDSGLTTLRMELPGVSPKDLDIELENGTLLRIKGSRSLLTSGQVMEFDQSFQLDSDVDPASLKVTLENGILEVVASKKMKTIQRLEIHTPESAVSTNEAKLLDTKEENQDPDSLTITEE